MASKWSGTGRSLNGMYHFHTMRTRFLLLSIGILLGSMSLLAQQVTDAGYRIVAHIKDDGIVQDASYRTIGHVKEDGTIQDANYPTIGHAENIPLRWAAFYFFFRQ